MVAGESSSAIKTTGLSTPRWYEVADSALEVARRDGLGPLCVSPAEQSRMHQQRPHLVQSSRACQPRASGYTCW